MDKTKVNKRQVKQLLTLLEKGTKSEQKSLLTFLDQHIIPYHLIQLENSKDKVIQRYVKARIKKLYTVKKSFENEFARRLDSDIDDIEGWGEASEKELSYFKRDTEKVLQGIADEFERDSTEAIELIRHNINLGLTSSLSYIRSLAELLAKKA